MICDSATGEIAKTVAFLVAAVTLTGEAHHGATSLARHHDDLAQTLSTAGDRLRETWILTHRRGRSRSRSVSEDRTPSPIGKDSRAGDKRRHSQSPRRRRSQSPRRRPTSRPRRRSPSAEGSRSPKRARHNGRDRRRFISPSRSPPRRRRDSRERDRRPRRRSPSASPGRASKTANGRKDMNDRRDRGLSRSKSRSRSLPRRRTRSPPSRRDRRRRSSSAHDRYRRVSPPRKSPPPRSIKKSADTGNDEDGAAGNKTIELPESKPHDPLESL
ncbi:hypothetical protein KVT40_009158 [Elsinoe batatas]|uniref:Uncharacterized protein n=1 Tax=Elsinoe batatas TaxID=2601811 RepID=A0A8K0PD30_9PEZI|nr:hypothetical protein KVT40_009158 [Elsinoe batatas]